MKLVMGILKIELKLGELDQAVEEFKKNRLRAFETITKELKETVSHTLNQLLKTEMTLFLGKADQSGNKRNGYYERDYTFKSLGCLRLRFPVDRHRNFKSEIIPPNEQIDPRLKEDVALLHLSGISTRMISMISKRVLGVEVSADTVSKSLNIIEPKALAWLERPLEKIYWALYIDGTNFSIQRRGSIEKEPSLVVLGVDSNHRRSILSIQPGQKDSVECWREVFKDLKKRGLKCSEVRLGIMDGLPGLETAFKEAFSNALTARCWVHAMKNVLSKTPARLEDSFKLLMSKVMYANSENEARESFKVLKETMQADAQRAVSCLEKDLDSLVAHYKFDKNFWFSLKTTNPIERVNKELKRRTKTMESVGERTLRVITAFIALRLEYQWQKVPIDSKRFLNLKNHPLNEIEATMENLLQ